MKYHIPDILLQKQNKIVVYNRQPISKYIMRSPTIINNQMPTIITNFLRTPVRTHLSQCTNCQQCHRQLLDRTTNPKVQNNNDNFLSTIHSKVDSHSIIKYPSTYNNYKINLPKTDKITIIQQGEVGKKSSQFLSQQHNHPILRKS